MTDLKHQPVLVADVLAHVPQAVKLVADLTIGEGGHCEAVLNQFGSEVELVGFDRDVEALGRARQRLSDLPNKKSYFHDTYAAIDDHLGKEYFGRIDFALLDLGLSSLQLDSSGRGFSFNRPDDPLDLRFDCSSGETLYNRLGQSNSDELKKVLSRYGEIRNSGRIATEIINAHQCDKLNCVGELVSLLRKYTRPDRENKFLAKVWQALRIWVNDELDQLSRGLERLIKYMNRGGVIAVISFHSLEDRIVKEFFLLQEKPCTCPPRFPKCVCGKKATMRRITRKPILPDAAEIAANSRARSAKLRVAERL